VLLFFALRAIRVNDSRGVFVPAPALQFHDAKARESYRQVPVKSRPRGWTIPHGAGN